MSVADNICPNFTNVNTLQKMVVQFNVGESDMILMKQARNKNSYLVTEY